MEARGFGGGPRTWARVSAYSLLDAWVLAGGLAVAGVAVTAAVRAGTWNMLWIGG
jgi:energy-coupling factor transport system permease protein